MENTEYTMKDIVKMVNESDGEFIIHVEFGEGEENGEGKETVQS